MLSSLTFFAFLIGMAVFLSGYFVWSLVFVIPAFSVDIVRFWRRSSMVVRSELLVFILYCSITTSFIFLVPTWAFISRIVVVQNKALDVQDRLIGLLEKLGGGTEGATKR